MNLICEMASVLLKKEKTYDSDWYLKCKKIDFYLIYIIHILFLLILTAVNSIHIFRKICEKNEHYFLSSFKGKSFLDYFSISFLRSWFYGTTFLFLLSMASLFHCQYLIFIGSWGHVRVTQENVLNFSYLLKAYLW